MKTLIIVASLFIASFLHAQTHKEIAETFINDLAQQEFEEAENFTDSTFQRVANADKLKDVWRKATAVLGNYESMDSITEIQPSFYFLYATFEKAQERFLFQLNDKNRIVGFFLNNTTFKDIPRDTTNYIQSELPVQVQGGVLKGSLMLPQNANAQTPVALIIAGSGPTDRDGNNPFAGAKLDTYKLLAEALAQNGIASFRYDKRLIGKSNDFSHDQSKLRFEDFVNDADSVLQFLKAKFLNVYIIGHSEGSLIGMLAGQKVKTAGYISLEGVGENIAKTLRRQLFSMKLMPAPMPLSDSLKIDSILMHLKAGKTVNDVPRNLQYIFAPAVQPYIISWMKYEPEKEIQKLECPVLIVQGDDDWKVKIQDAENLKHAKPDARLVVIKGMNHDLAYSIIGTGLAPELITSIVAFIKK